MCRVCRVRRVRVHSIDGSRRGWLNREHKQMPRVNKERTKEVL